MQPRIIRLLTALVMISTLLGCAKGQNYAPIRIGTSTPASEGSLMPTSGQNTGLGASDSTPEVTADAVNAATQTPIVPTINPTYLVLPTITPTPTLDMSKMLLRIVSPGPMSKVISPVEFVVHIDPGYTGVTRVELIGEDGLELYRRVFKTFSNIGYFTRVDELIKFEIRGAAEIARLQISTLDSNGRLQAFNSVRLLLQAVGENEFTPVTQQQDRLFLRYPQQAEEVRGDSLPIIGEFLPATDLVMVMELIDEKGQVLGSRLLQLGPANGNYQQFTTSIPFTVLKKTPARLVIRQSDDRIAGLAYLFSQEIVLFPK